MFKYLLFRTITYETMGGMEDFYFGFNTYEEFADKFKNEPRYVDYHLLNTKTMEVIHFDQSPILTNGLKGHYFNDNAAEEIWQEKKVKLMHDWIKSLN